jgi:RimJ/RimL family protein N-acetyltransferase
MSWIQHVVLKGVEVDLIPLDEKHFPALDALGSEKKIWEFIPIDMSTSAQRIQVFENAIISRIQGTQYPFAIYSKEENKLIGSTRFMNIEQEHKKLEIGWTWLHPDYWNTTVNLECKLLLLTFCFQELKAIRVQLKTDANNTRSQKAIQKIGAKYEGTLRHDWIRANGTIRDSLYFSIINTEWPETREKLSNLLKTKNENTRNHRRT